MRPPSRSVESVMHADRDRKIENNLEKHFFSSKFMFLKTARCLSAA